MRQVSCYFGGGGGGGGTLMEVSSFQELEKRSSTLYRGVHFRELE